MANNKVDTASNIPEDVLIYILVMLPVKSLMRFLCVNKYWYALIQSPSFIRNHYKHYPNSMLLVHRFVSEYEIFHSPNPSSLLDKFVLSSLGFNIVTKDNLHTVTGRPNIDDYLGEGRGVTCKQFSLAAFHDYDIDTICRVPHLAHSEVAATAPPYTDIIDMIETSNIFYRWHTITGPVDGLFLLYNGYEYGDFYNKLAVWNPATTELRILPLPNSHFLKNLKSEYVFGFGFDDLTNDYKVVWFTSWPGERLQHEIPHPPDVALYSLGTNTWRIFNAVLPYASEILPSNSAYLSGVRYWVSGCLVKLNNSKSCEESRLVAFDFSTDVFREVKIPNSITCRLDTKQNVKLVLHNDNSVALLVYKKASVVKEGVHTSAIDTIDMWVMMNEEGCWSKLFSLGLDSSLYLANPIGFWKSKDEIFFTTNADELVLYNVDTDKLHHLGIRCDPFPREFLSYYLPIYKYKESLVSFGGQKNCKLNGAIQDFLAFDPTVPT